MLQNKEYIIIHHSATFDGKTNDWKSIKNFHIQVRKWNDIGYNYGIEKIDGHYILQEGRPLHMDGAHTIGYNQNSIGICIIGNYDTELPESTPMTMLKDMCQLFMKQYNIPKENILGHWETFIKRGLAQDKTEAWTKYKTCPGKVFPIEIFRNIIL